MGSNYLHYSMAWLLEQRGESGSSFEEYNSGQSWTKDQIILKDGEFYQANEDIPVNAPFVVGASGQTWGQLSSESLILISDFNLSRDYVEDEVIQFQGNIFRAKGNISAGAFNRSNWESISGPFIATGRNAAPTSLNNEVEGYADGSTWFLNNGDGYIKTGENSGNALWKAIGAAKNATGMAVAPTDTNDSSEGYTVSSVWVTTADLGFVMVNEGSGSGSGAVWLPLQEEFHTVIPNFDQTKSYLKDQITIYDMVIYRAIAAVSPGTFNPTQWMTVKSTVLVAEDHSSSKTYGEDQLVVRDGGIYRCKTDIPAKAWDEAEWEVISSGTIWRDTWLLTNTYISGDVVVHNNRLWSANSDIAANTAFVEGSGANKWTEISPPASPKAPDWSDSTGYKQYELVIEGGKLYRALADHPARASFDVNDWEAISAEAVTVAANYSGVKNYVKHELVYKNGSLWRAKAVKPGGAWDETLWDLISGSNKVFVLDHSDSTDYEENELVTLNNKLYRCTSTHSAKTFDIADWEEVSMDTTVVFDHDDSLPYKEGNLVTVSGKLYRCKADIAAKAFDEADWDSLGSKYVIVDEFANAGVYLEGQLVWINGACYRTKTDRSAGPVTDADLLTDFDPIFSFGSFRGDWNQAFSYSEDDVVYNKSRKTFYRAKSNIASNTAFDTNTDAEWEVVGERSRFRGEYSESERYERDDIVVYNDVLWICSNGPGVGDGADGNTWNSSLWTEMYKANVGTTLVEHTLVAGVPYTPDLDLKDAHVRMEITDTGSHQIQNPTGVFGGQRCTLTFRGTDSANGRTVTFNNAWYDYNGVRLVWAKISGTASLSLDFVRDGTVMRCVTPPSVINTTTPLTATMTSQDLVKDLATGSLYSVDGFGNPYAERYDALGRAVIPVANATLVPNLSVGTSFNVKLANDEDAIIDPPASDALDLFGSGKRYANLSFFLNLASTGNETSVTFNNDYVNLDGTPIGKVAKSDAGSLRLLITFFPEWNGTKTIYRATTQVTSTTPSSTTSDYSTSERLTGRKWIDGKDIYEIVVTGPPSNADNTTFTGAVPGVDNVVSAKRSYVSNNIINAGYGTSSSQAGLLVYKANGNISVWHNAEGLTNSDTVTVVLEYTKV